MRFLDIFSAQHDSLIIGFVMAQNFLNFDLICARGSCLKRVPVNRFSQILSIHFQMTISQPKANSFFCYIL